MLELDLILTQEAISLTKYAEKAGADGALVVTPYYNKPTQEGLYQHYKAINDNCGIPILFIIFHQDQ